MSHIIIVTVNYKSHNVTKYYKHNHRLCALRQFGIWSNQ